MSLNYKRLLTLCLLPILLCGCKQSYSDEYLFQNPDVLEKELSRCQDSNDATPYCASIKKSAELYVQLANKQHENPEDFGKEILQLEADLVRSKEALQQAKDSNQDKEKLAAIEEAYQAQLRKLKTYLAVVAGTSSPG